jgi:uncharacterized membrane protein (Fun14 family)
MQRAYKTVRLLSYHTQGLNSNASARSLVIGASHGGGQSGGGGGQGGSGDGWHHGDGHGGRRQLTWGMGSALLALAVSLPSASAATSKKEDKHKVISVDQPELTVDAVVDLGWKIAGPILSNLGFSGVCGFAAGYAAKKIGQTVAVLVGLAFIAIQGLAYQGIITVNWANIESMVKKNLDINGDGKLDEKDFKLISTQGLSLISQGVPSVGGFLTGFLFALRF